MNWTYIKTRLYVHNTASCIKVLFCFQTSHFLPRRNRSKKKRNPKKRYLCSQIIHVTIQIKHSLFFCRINILACSIYFLLMCFLNLLKTDMKKCQIVTVAARLKEKKMVEHVLIVLILLIYSFTRPTCTRLKAIFRNSCFRLRAKNIQHCTDTSSAFTACTVRSCKGE